jgi:hypothetical protein
MSTCPPNLVHSFLTDCEIITFKVDKIVIFPCAKGGHQSFEGSKNSFFKQAWIVRHFILVSKYVVYMSTKSHTHRRCGTLRKKLFPTRGYAEIHIQRPVFFYN